MAIVSFGWVSLCLAVPENIALNKPYTWSSPPNYALCTDPGDKTQLTDGVYSEGRFWSQKETVGWQKTRPVQCVIDLGRIEPICGALWSTAAGVAQVTPPETVLVLVSEDGVTWTFLGDLCELGTTENTPPDNGYAIFRFASDQMQGRGRYVCVIATAFPYCFVDEIEIWRGPDTWLCGELPGKRTGDLKRFYEESRIHAGVSARLRNDLKHIFTQAEALGFGEALAGAGNTVDALQNQIPAAAEVASSASDEFQTILPYGNLHKRILALNAPVLRAAGVLHPLVWQGNRWDPLTLSVIPPQGSATDSVRLDLMRGEVRSEILNITNPSDHKLDLRVSLNGMPDRLHLELREVLVTDTQSGEPIAAALRPLAADAQGIYRLLVPAGCTRQLWLACNRPDIASQTYAGTILIASPDAAFSQTLTLRVHIRNLIFPKQPLLHVGGWDYTQGEGNYYKAPGNRDENLALMKGMYVDSPWATKAVFPKGARFDTDGQLLNADALDFSVWDTWVHRWQGARNYCVFFSVGNSFEGDSIGTPRFDAKVGSWLTAWVRHMACQGLSPEQLVILLVDEPNERTQDAVLIAWAEAVQSANLGVVLFTDPTYTDPREGNPAMFAAHDVLCPKSIMLLTQGESFREFYQSQRAAGKTLWLYSCDGPAKLLDPITYHRAQAWIAFQIGAQGSFYWSFGCGGGIGNSWRAYVQGSNEYSPYFVGPTSVMEGKHSEALREGVQDYEYLCMLREQIDKARASGSDPAWVRRADELLDRGVAEAVAAIVPSNMQWHVTKNRSALDDVRIRLLDTLEDSPYSVGVTYFDAFSDPILVNTSQSQNRRWEAVCTNAVHLEWTWGENATRAELRIVGMNATFTTNFPIITTSYLWRPLAGNTSLTEDVYHLTLTFYGSKNEVVEALTSRLAVIQGAFGRTRVISTPEGTAWPKFTKNAVIFTM